MNVFLIQMSHPIQKRLQPLLKIRSVQLKIVKFRIWTCKSLISKINQTTKQNFSNVLYARGSFHQKIQQWYIYWHITDFLSRKSKNLEWSFPQFIDFLNSFLENKNSKRKDLNCNHPTSNQHIPKIPLTFGTLRSTPKN